MNTHDDLLLIPTPRQIRRGLGAWRVPRGWTHASIPVARLPAARSPEHYTLAITPAGPRIESASTAATRAAIVTIDQLRTSFGDTLPCVDIEDWPAFAKRGVMLDVSRNRIPRMDEFRRIIATLAKLKINHLQLYTEYTFAYENHEDAWRGWSPLTADEICRLDECAASHGIELAANQNCFGHLAHWLRLPRYQHLAETHGDWMFDVWPRSGPFSLCPTDPASLAFVGELLAELLPNFSSPLVNIGCDETYDIAYGRSKDEVAKRGRGAVFTAFVNKIADLCRDMGKRPMFWADIALSHPECLRDLPKDMVALAWGYESDADFDRWCSLVREAGQEVWVSPGTSSWRSITGRTSERHGNINSAARAGISHGAAGLLACDWGDTGHWQQWPVALHGIAHAAHAAWTGVSESFNAGAAAMHALGVSNAEHAHDVGAWLERLGDADLPARRVAMPLSRPGVAGHIRNQTAIFIDLFKGWNEALEVGGAAWAETGSRLDQLARERPRTGLPVVDDELEHTMNLAQFAAARAVVRRDGGDKREVLDKLTALIPEHRRLWFIRSRPGGLETSCGFFEQVREKTANR